MVWVLATERALLATAVAPRATALAPARGGAVVALLGLLDVFVTDVLVFGVALPAGLGLGLALVGVDAFEPAGVFRAVGVLLVALPDFFAAGFGVALTTFFATVFFAAVFFVAGLLATAFFAAGFLTADFFAAGLAAAALRELVPPLALGFAVFGLVLVAEVEDFFTAGFVLFFMAGLPDFFAEGLADDLALLTLPDAALAARPAALAAALRMSFAELVLVLLRVATVQLLDALRPSGRVL